MIYFIDGLEIIPMWGPFPFARASNGMVSKESIHDLVKHLKHQAPTVQKFHNAINKSARSAVKLPYERRT